MLDITKTFYGDELFNPKVEVNSFGRDQQNVVKSTGGLMNTSLMAFQSHYPLKISPDHVWTCLGVFFHFFFFNFFQY